MSEDELLKDINKAKLERKRQDMMIKEYLKDRDEAMLAYPDTTKLDELIKKYPEYYSVSFKALFESAVNSTKVRTLELMIGAWTEAPEWLKQKVKEASDEV